MRQCVSGDDIGPEKLLIDDHGREENIAPPPAPPLALRSPFRFGGQMLGVIFLLKISFALLVLLPLYLLWPMKGIFAEMGSTEEVLRGGKLAIFISFLILPIETFFGQGLPIWVFSKCHVKGHRVLCGLSAICFGLLHMSSGVPGVFNGFLGGLVLSYCWLSWRPDSIRLAFWGTTFVHAAHNGVALIFFGLLSGLGSDISPKPSPGMEPPAYMDRADRTGIIQKAAGEQVEHRPSLPL